MFFIDIINFQSKNNPNLNLFYQFFSDLDYINMVYKASYCRIGPYCIGILMAYIYHRRNAYNQRKYLLSNDENSRDDNNNHVERIKHNYSTFTGLMLMAIAIIMLISTTMLTYPWLQGWDYVNVPSILYGAIHRNIWAIGWALLIWAMTRQHLPLMDRIFSHPMFQVFSKLTYQSYLLHSILISAITNSLRQKIYFSEFNFVSIFFYHLNFLIDELFFPTGIRCNLLFLFYTINIDHYVCHV